MANKVNMSLDEIIQSNRKKFRFNANRRGGRGAGTGSVIRNGGIQKRGRGTIRNRRSNFSRGPVFERVINPEIPVITVDVRGAL